MKSIMIFILIGLVVFLGFSVSVLKKELLNAREHTKAIEERNNKLHRELMRLASVNNENERFLSELEQSIREFENKMPLTTLEKYVPKQVLNDVKPVIDRLQAFQRVRENSILPGEEANQD